jgi:hypothetical protein
LEFSQKNLKLMIFFQVVASRVVPCATLTENVPLVMLATSSTLLDIVNVRREGEGRGARQRGREEGQRGGWRDRWRGTGKGQGWKKVNGGEGTEEPERRIEEGQGRTEGGRGGGREAGASVKLI